MNYLSKTKGFDSKEYKDYSSGLAEGDEEMQKSITNILKRAHAKRLTDMHPRQSAGKRAASKYFKK